MLVSIDQDIKIILDKQVQIKFSFDSLVCGFHVLQRRLVEGSEFFDEKENKTYKFAIAVYRNDVSQRIIVGNVPMNISKVLVKFLKLPSSFLTCKVTGKQVNRGAGYCLKSLMSYTYTEYQKTIDWNKKNKNEENNSIQKMKNECLKKHF